MKLTAPFVASVLAVVALPVKAPLNVVAFIFPTFEVIVTAAQLYAGVGDPVIQTTG